MQCFRREVDGLRKVGNAKFKFNVDVDPCQVGRKAALDTRKLNHTVWDIERRIISKYKYISMH